MFGSKSCWKTSNKVDIKIKTEKQVSKASHSQTEYKDDCKRTGMGRFGNTMFKNGKKYAVLQLDSHL